MAMLRPPDPMKYVAFGDHPATNAIHTANFPDILFTGHQRRSLFYQPVRAFAARVPQRAGQRKNFTPLLQCAPCGNQRSTSNRSFDHQHATA